jgi:hypothetical protein
MMKKAFSPRPWRLLLGLALTCLAVGCSEPNEGGAESGLGGTKGVANPKYAAGTPEQYIQAHKDQEKAPQTKAKGAAPKAEAPTAADPTEHKP